MSLVYPAGSHDHVFESQGARHTLGANIVAGGHIIEYGDTTAVVHTTGGTVATTSDVVVSNPAAAITGVILAAGTVDKQLVTIINIAAAVNTITFAAAGTSNVADGVSSVIAGLNARTFIWSATAARWYPVK